jgi:hypothetical protein
MSSDIYITFEKGTAQHAGLKVAWKDFCETRGMIREPGNGCYHLGRIESSTMPSVVVFSTSHMGDYIDDAARLGMAFWVAHGGDLSASPEMREALSRHVPGTRPGSKDDGRTHFDHVEFSSVRRGYIGWTPDGRVVPMADLEGKTVNIGDKNGGVYEGVTVTGFDGRALTVQGGGYGTIFGSREAEPFPGTRRIYAHDIARGYIHAAQAQA